MHNICSIFLYRSTIPSLLILIISIVIEIRREGACRNIATFALTTLLLCGEYPQIQNPTNIVPPSPAAASAMSNSNYTDNSNDYDDVLYNNTGARNYTSEMLDGTKRTTSVVMFVFFTLFSICVFMCKFSIFRQHYLDSRQSQRRQAREAKKELRRQKNIEENIIVRTISSNVTKEEGAGDVETPPPVDKNSEGDKATTALYALPDDWKTCAICLGDYVEGEKVCLSRNPDCSHFFHSTCGIAWLAKHSECPICRAEFIFEDHLKEKHDNSSSHDDDDDDGGTATAANASASEIESSRAEDGDDGVDENQETAPRRHADITQTS